MFELRGHVAWKIKKTKGWTSKRAWKGSMGKWRCLKSVAIGHDGREERGMKLSFFFFNTNVSPLHRGLTKQVSKGKMIGTMAETKPSLKRTMGTRLGAHTMR